MVQVRDWNSNELFLESLRLSLTMLLSSIQKAAVDLVVGTGLTATGVNWIPSIGLTGFPVMPILQFELKPEELRELQVAQGQGQTQYYLQLKTRLEADLAVRFTQNLLAAQTALRSAAVLEREVIPQLQSQLDAEQSRAVPGAASVAATSAARRLDEAKGRLEQSRLAGRQALAVMNYLMGRPEDAPLQVDLDGEDLQKLAFMLDAAVSNRIQALAGNRTVAA